MRYLARSVKYFFYLIIILVIVIGGLMAFKIVDTNPATLFVNGYDSYWQIALIMAALALVYPRWGFSTRRAHINGSFEEIKGGIVEVMENYGYKLEKEEGENMSFVKRSPVSRAFKMWEDRITFTREIAGYDLEGLTRDLPRLISALEFRFRVGE